MNCPYCGASIDTATPFCPNCGARLANQAPKAAPVQPNPYQQPQQYVQQPVQQSQEYQGYAQQPVQQPVALQSQPKKEKKSLPKFDLKAFFSKIKLPKLPKKVLIGGGAAIALLLVVAIVVSLLPSGSAFTPKKSNLSTLRPDDTLLIIQDGKLVDDSMDVTVRSNVSSLDGTVTILRTSENEVYVVSKGKMEMVAEDILYCTVSADGSTILCIDKDNTLYTYSAKDQKENHIADDVRLASISPDGKTVVYTVNDDGDLIGYIYDGKKSTELDDEIAAFAVSNGGKYIYCLDMDDNLVLYNKKGEKTKLGTDVDDDQFLLNKDHTQIIFMSKDKWYVSVKGGDKVKLSSSSDLTLIQPLFSGSLLANSCAYTYNVDSLNEKFYDDGDDAVLYINKKWEAEKVAKEVDSRHLANDGKTLLYLRCYGTLNNVTTKKLGDPVELADDVSFFSLVPDGSGFYFADEDDTFWYQKGTKDPKRIAEDVTLSTMTHDGYCLFMSDYSGGSGTLYASRNGGKKEQVSSDAYLMLATSTHTLVLYDYDKSESSFSADVATKGTKFKTLYD